MLCWNGANACSKPGPRSAGASCFTSPGERPEVERAVDAQRPAGRVHPRVHQHERAGHRVADDDGPLDAELRRAARGPAPRRSSRSAGGASLSPWPGRSMAMVRHVVAEAVDDRAPAAAIEREAVQQHDGGARCRGDSYARRGHRTRRVLRDEVSKRSYRNDVAICCQTDGATARARRADARRAARRGRAAGRGRRAPRR